MFFSNALAKKLTILSKENSLRINSFRTFAVEICITIHASLITNNVFIQKWEKSKLQILSLS
jgi:hypothetical protein